MFSILNFESNVTNVLSYFVRIGQECSNKCYHSVQEAILSYRWLVILVSCHTFTPALLAFITHYDTIYVCESFGRCNCQEMAHLKNEKVFYHQSCDMSLATMAKFHELGFELLHHPPYSPDFDPSDYWL